jgi:hypothetical protein
MYLNNVIYYNSALWDLATQTKNFLSSFSPFGGGVGGGAEQRNARKFLGLPRGTPRAEVLPAQSGRTIQVQATTRSARAKWVRAKANISPPSCAFSDIEGCSRLTAGGQADAKHELIERSPYHPPEPKHGVITSHPL